MRSVGIWLMQTLLVTLLLLVLWHPALSVATLRPQQNIVAVVVDDSKSMAFQEGGTTRRDQAVQALNSGLLKNLEKKFQVRLYRAGKTVERIDKPEELAAGAPSTNLGENLKQVAGEASSLPVGAVVLLSDGSDNGGGIDLATINEIRRQRIPVHTVGFGREKLAHDIELTGAELPARTLADSRVSAIVTFHQNGYGGGKARINVKDGAKTLATQEVTLKSDGTEQTESLAFNAGAAGARNVQISVDPQNGEENLNNNVVNRLISVEGDKPRVLYIEGEPRWEFKFIRRAIDLDRSLL